MGDGQARIIAVANEKGGVGKTAMVVNLGAALSLENKRVLVVDMDPQHNATIGLGVNVADNMPSVYDLITDDDPPEARQVVLSTSWENLDLIPSHIDLAGAELELADLPGRETKLAEALSDLTGEYDFILIDTPPSLSLLTVNVFACATEVLVPCHTHPYALKALDDLFDTIDNVREGINQAIRITGIVPTFFDKRTSLSQRMVDRLRQDERYAGYLFDSMIRTNTAVALSSDVGKPVVFFRKSSYGAWDYSRLAEELLAKE